MNKDKLPRALAEGVSDCCRGPLLVGGRTTHYYVCGTCNQACWVAPEEPDDA